MPGARVTWCLAVLVASPSLAASGAESQTCRELHAALSAGVELGIHGTDFEGALAQFDRALKLGCTSSDEVQLHLYRGIVLFNLRRPAPAREAFEKALKLDTKATLPGQFGKKVEALLEQVRSALPPAPAATPGPVEPPSEQPGAVSDVPAVPAASAQGPDGPQVASSAPPVARRSLGLPIALTAASALLAGIGVGFGAVSSRQVHQAQGSMFQDETVLALSTARTNALVANVLFATASAVLIAAVVTWLLAARAPEPAT